MPGSRPGMTADDYAAGLEDFWAGTNPAMTFIQRNSRSRRALAVGRVIMHLDLAGNNVRLGGVRRGLGLWSQDALVPFVDRVIDAAFLQAERLDAGLPGPILGVHERLVSRNFDMLQHRGQNLARKEIVLIRID